MPRPPRDERRAELARTAQRWSRWLKPAIAQREIDIKTLVDRAGQAGATFDKSNVSKWLAGDSTADPTNAAIIGRVLGRDPLEALHEAGWHLLADQLAAKPSVEEILRIARHEDASAPVLLREAGYSEEADYIESITGPGGPRPIDLDEAIARTREIIGDMTPEELDAYEKSLLRQIRESRKRAEEAPPGQRVHTANGNGTQGVS